MAQALDYLHEAQELHRQLGERHHATILLGLIAEVYLPQRRFDLAIPQLAATVEATAIDMHPSGKMVGQARGDRRGGAGG